MNETLYKKVGRKYVPYAIEWTDKDTLKTGQFRLHYAYTDGGGMYFYDVKPDTAGFVAAAMVAHKAIEESIREASKPRPSGETIHYTKKQLEIIKRYREEMMQAGGMLPEWWAHTRPWDIADAAINAVRNFKP